jgi:CelD/BcsL family acetyltransferase involved in cellulose biosynthesis
MNIASGGLNTCSRADPFEVHFITQLAEMEPLAQQWEILNETASDHDAPFFQSYAWNRHIARIRLERSPDRFKLLIAVIRSGGDLIGIWPLSLQLSSGAWIARSLDDPFGQFAGVVFRRTDDVTPGIAAVVNMLRVRKLADGLRIEGLLVGSALHSALIAAGAATSEANQAVYVDLRPHATVADFRQSINKKTRKNLRNLRNRFERAHRLTELVIDDRSQLEPVLAETLAARQRWMDDYGHTSPAFRNSDFKPAITSLATAMSINLLGFCLVTDEGVASAQWGFVYLGRYYAYLSGKNPDYNEFSPGRLHLGLVIEACMARGIKFLELMAPASDYKLDWTNRTKRLDTAVIPMTIRGRITISLQKLWTTPWVRDLSHTLPEPIRKALVRKLNRTPKER